MPLWTFLSKIRCQKTFIWSFFGIVCILTTVQYYHRNKWNTKSLFTTRAIKNGVCLHLCCSSALTKQEIHNLKTPYICSKFWETRAKNYIKVPLTLFFENFPQLLYQNFLNICSNEGAIRGVSHVFSFYTQHFIAPYE